ncbi:DUF4349 domain-containing protein [Halorientalis litorea]|jgi:hypothetical protein|uniref:DUF4349 domain-containing protein n=1 Tax=Halorientalis litorea TaxID=2931977 RepID=UPI001FF34324|nr:DUF4349 domain-containing protein [Halorientalis litorea]
MATDHPWRRVALALVLVALVALAGCNAQLGSSQGGGGDSGGAPDVGAGGGGGVGSYYGDDGERIVVREADMSLRVENFSRSFRSLRAVADRYGGYLGDRRQRSEGEWDTGMVTVRVPAENFSAARDAVADLGRVEDESVRALDFTGQYRDRQERIRQLERDQRELERVLNRTENASAAADLRDELQEVRNELRELRSQQSQLRQRQALSTIRVDMHEPESRRPPQTFETAFGFADAFASAFNGGLTAVKYVIVFFGYAIPVGFAALLFGTFGFGLWSIWLRLRDRLQTLFGPSDRPPAPTSDATGEDDGGGDGDDED